MDSGQSRKGFTIIEVVLVLAIAGLIFIMVFTALPALQRQQRDTARKDEVSRIIAAIASYQSNNRGQSPGDDASTFGPYLDSINTGSGETITLTSGTTVTRYSGSISGSTSIPGVTQDNIVFVIGAKCDTGNSVVSGSARQAAVIVQLEEADGIYFCQNG